LSTGSRNRPVGDRAVTGAGFLPSPNGLEVYQGQQAGVIPRGVTPVGGASLQRGPSSPLATDVSVLYILVYRGIKLKLDMYGIWLKLKILNIGIGRS